MSTMPIIVHQIEMRHRSWWTVLLTRRLCAAFAAVYVWGRGEYGRLGLGDKSGSSRLKATLVESLVHETVVQAVCGGTHTMALTVEGRIYIWGRGSFGDPRAISLQLAPFVVHKMGNRS